VENFRRQQGIAKPIGSGIDFFGSGPGFSLARLLYCCSRVMLDSHPTGSYPCFAARPYLNVHACETIFQGFLPLVGDMFSFPFTITYEAARCFLHPAASRRRTKRSGHLNPGGSTPHDAKPIHPGSVSA